MATSYLSPGVYVEEVDRGSKPIEAVGTNTVGFIGVSSRGPLNEAILVTNWSQFTRTFGDFSSCDERLAHAVYGFFGNGGSRCFVVNIGHTPETVEILKTTLSFEVSDDIDDTVYQKFLDELKMVHGHNHLELTFERSLDSEHLVRGFDNGPDSKTGIHCFDDIDEIAIVVAPGFVSPEAQNAILEHCETHKDRFAILDSPETISGGVDQL